MGRFIGVDLHKTAFTVCFLEGEEKRFVTYKIGEIGWFCAGLKADDEVAVETTTNTRHFVRKIQGHVGKVHMINTMQFKVVSQSVCVFRPKPATYSGVFRPPIPKQTGHPFRG